MKKKTFSTPIHQSICVKQSLNVYVELKLGQASWAIKLHQNLFPFVFKKVVFFRFHGTIIKCLKHRQAEVVELHVPLTPNMNHIQTCLLDIMNYTVKQLRSINRTLDMQVCCPVVPCVYRGLAPLEVTGARAVLAPQCLYYQRPCYTQGRIQFYSHVYSVSQIIINTYFLFCLTYKKITRIQCLEIATQFLFLL